MGGTPRPGAITWTDLTVADADRLRDFYQSVIGWAPEPVAMGGYADYVMNDAGGAATAGICHARGSNADLPAQWLVYITVDDLEHSVAECQRLGGSIVAPPRGYAGGRYCVIKDPAGAVCALYQPPDAA
jgi:predicted enzyme related to lactoylglutathione lyase